MSLPIAAPKAVPPTLAQQKADFTAEGAPPPGQVSTTIAATADPDSVSKNPTAARGRKATRSKRPPAAR
jgi:hypothetical protein